MMDQILSVSGFEINLSPFAFKTVAQHTLAAADSFRPTDFSVVPYFLYSRAIELALKAVHLEDKKQREVKDLFGHDLVGSYRALPDSAKTLSSSEESLLEQTSELYRGKHFEYMRPIDAAKGFTNFPDLAALASLAARMVMELPYYGE